MKKGWKAFMAAAMALLMAGCGKTADPAGPVSGGRINNTDPDAPKVIQSKEITEFYTSFYLNTRWTAEENHSFQFQVKPDGNGAWTVTEPGSEITCAADETLLTELQDVIDRNELASKNGICEYTAGVAPAYGACILRVTYASGEILNFTVDNDPEAEWSAMFCDVFAEWFQKNDISWELEKWEDIDE